MIVPAEHLFRIGKPFYSLQQRRQTDQVTADQIQAEYAAESQEPPAMESIIQLKCQDQSRASFTISGSIPVVILPLRYSGTECAGRRQQDQQHDGKGHRRQKLPDLFQHFFPRTQGRPRGKLFTAVSVMAESVRFIHRQLSSGSLSALRSLNLQRMSA